MHVKEAIVLRFKNLCNQNNIKFNELATRSGVTPSTVYSMMNENRKDISIITVKKLCDGLEISISDFFADNLFNNLEPEIK